LFLPSCVPLTASAHRLAAPALMLLSGCSMYVGASFGVLLFDYIPPAGVAWLRIAVSALILVVLVRPGRRAWTGRPMALAGMFGLVTALMNICFYEAIARLPLGTAVAIEFLGPIAVVAAQARSARGWVSLLAAAGGVVLIADVQLAAQPLGVVFALLAAGFWAGYVVLGKVVAVRANSLDSLAVGWVISAVVTAPLVIVIVRGWTAPDALGRVVWMVAALAVLSSVVPYALDQLMLRMVGRARFALLLALLPVSAVLIGLLALAQVPTRTELIGIALVVVALASTDREKESAPARPSPQGGGAEGS
jgi:inner membrane transporter RhtA